MSSFDQSLLALPGNDLSSDTSANSEQKFLRISLGTEDTALLAVDSIVAILRVSKPDILPVPQMPNHVPGIYNWRGKMLWLIDLDHFLGLLPAPQAASFFDENVIVVIWASGQFLGLVIRQVDDIESHDPQKIKAPPAGLFSSSLLPYVQGYLADIGSLILDAGAVAQMTL